MQRVNCECKTVKTVNNTALTGGNRHRDTEMSRKSLKNQLQTHHISTVSVLHLSLCLTVTGLWSKLQLVWLKSRVHCCLCLSVFSLIFLRDKTAWLLTPASSTEETHSGVQPLMDACRETFLRFIRFSQIYHRKKPQNPDEEINEPI